MMQNNNLKKEIDFIEELKNDLINFSILSTDKKVISLEISSGTDLLSILKTIVIMNMLLNP